LRQQDSDAIGPSLAAAATIVAVGFLGSRVLGLVRSVVIADAFGTSPELGAYWVAFRLPDLIFQLLAGATLGAAFIPVFARKFTQQSPGEAWRLASSVLNLVATVTVVFAVLGFILAPWLVPAMAPGLDERSLAVDLTRIMMVSPILFAISGMFMGILNARHHFLFPAIAPWFYNLSIIVAALVSDDVHGLAVGVVVGALLHLAVQLPALRIVGMSYAPIADWRDAAVREVGRLMAPRMLGLAAFQLNLLIMVFFASRVSDEAISAVNYGWLIIMTPLGLFGMAISTAVFPTLAEQAVRDRDELRRTVAQSLRLILFLTIPSSVALMILSEPLIAFLFERGAFTAASTDITEGVLLFFAVGLFAHAGIEILSRGFYALGDTRTPVKFAAAAVVANLLLCLVFVDPFGVRGLAMAMSLATVLEFSLLLRALNRRLEGLEVDHLVYSLIRTAGATILMAEVIGLLMVMLSVGGLLNTGNLIDSFLAVAGGAVLGGAAFCLAAHLLRSQEMAALLRRIPALRPT
jgi:putative peptidoglycan lipid II flippase